MSRELENSARISELEEKVGVLSVQIEDLAASVEQLTQALQRLQTSDFQVVTPVASETSSVSAARSIGSHGTYQGLAQEIPALPESSARICALLTGGQLSARERAARAWESGYWARFCLQGRISQAKAIEIN